MTPCTEIDRLHDIIEAQQEIIAIYSRMYLEMHMASNKKNFDPENFSVLKKGEKDE